MNFSNTKKLRKILSLVIVLATMASLFAGCSKKKPEPTEEPTINLDDLVAPSTAPAETQPDVTEPQEINENMATVLSQLNVRSSPTDQATQVGTLYAGDKVEIDQVQTSLGIEWGHIYSPMTGWVCMEFVEMDYHPDEPTEPTQETTPADKDRPNDDVDPIDKLDKDTGGNGSSTVLFKGTVTASELNIRKTASTSADSVGSLKRGTTVEILEKNGDWGRVKQGWISLQHVKVDNGSSNNTSNNNTSTDKGNGSTSVVARGIVNTAELNIRADANQNSDRVGSYTSGTRVEILEKSNGWGRTSKGWIALNYVYIDGTGTGNNKHGVVTGSGLNIRSGPGKNYDSVGSLNEGNDVTILYRVTVGGTTWGNIKQGWISMDYVELDDPDDDSNDSANSSSSNERAISAGIITADDSLNVRKAASSDSDKVGTVSYGTRVEIYEKSNGWARINKGWVNMDYVYEDGSGDGGEYGEISGSGVNIRSGPGKNYGIVGSLSRGDEVSILFQLKVGDTTWGNIKQGWISMAYVDVG